MTKDTNNKKDGTRRMPRKPFNKDGQKRPANGKKPAAKKPAAPKAESTEKESK